MLRVEPIQKGIVLDHIRAGMGMRIFQELGLGEKGLTVALLMNVPSTKLGRKDMIKITGVLDLDLTKLGLLDPGITVNYIEGGMVVRKVKPGLPERVVGLIRCRNPRCITSTESYVAPEFTLVNPAAKEYRCAFCGERVRV
ncbi:aspartate carbamoyltransferase regulatory subunit [Candidatus Bipolaricaulota bacterium]|nr:aspartate carbamoyltransferase regulatory subunit [Candidatus Bipolaricaulota bacterium]